MNEQLIARDRLRYSKNKLSSGFALLSILFNALFFASIYRGVRADIGVYYFNITIGASVLTNLAFMLAAFLSSEGVKNYKFPFAIVLLVLAAVQIGRIFVYPLGAHTAVISEGDEALKHAMETPQFIRCIVYLVCSAACLVVAGVFGIIRTLELKAHMAKYGDSKIDFEAEETEVPVADVNAEDEGASAEVLSEEPIAQDQREGEE